MVRVRIIKGIINMWKYLLLMYDGREIFASYGWDTISVPQ